jgi:hypothetical protein
MCSSSKLIIFILYELVAYGVLVLILIATIFLQLCVKWCSHSERDPIFVALQPHLLDLSLDEHTVFLVHNIIKMGKFLYDSLITHMCSYVRMLLVCLITLSFTNAPLVCDCSH